MNPPTPPPYEVMMQMLLARTISYSLGALARLSIADHMPADGSLTSVETIAAAAKVQPGALYRVMRMLASTGVLSQEGRNFGLTPVTALLRGDAAGSMRNMAMMLTSPWVTDGLTRLSESIASGVDGVTLAYGKNTWELFPEIPDQAEVFQRAMQNLTANAVAALLDAYDFSGVATLADVGGGYGTLLAGVLEKYPAIRGVLFDLPEPIAHAGTAGLLAPFGERARMQAGSFFETVPAGCEVYVLKHIIHDWSDGHSGKILKQIRQNMAPTGKLLLFEMIVPETNEPGPAKVLDIEMLIATVGGKERTLSEFESLFARSGFRLNRVVPTMSPMSVLEAVPAS